MRGFYFTTICSLKFCLIGFMLSSCNYHVDKLGANGADANGFNDKTTIDAAYVQQGVLGICLRCHAGNTNPELSSLASVRDHSKLIQSEVMSNSMPPANAGYRPLTDCQKAVLNEWIAQNMPDVSTKRVVDLKECRNGIPNDPTEISILKMPLNYATLTSRILQPSCLNCHSEGSNDPDASAILLFPYTKLISHRNLLGKNSAQSKFFNIVKRTDEERMPPPEDSGPLSAEQLEFIRRWIDAGHPEK